MVQSRHFVLTMVPTGSSTVLLDGTCPHNNLLCLCLLIDRKRKVYPARPRAFDSSDRVRRKNLMEKKTLAHFACFHVWRLTSANQYLSFVNVPCMCGGSSWPGKSNLWPSYHYKRVVWCLGKPRSLQAGQLRILLLGERTKTQKGAKGHRRREKALWFAEFGAPTCFFCCQRYKCN